MLDLHFPASATGAGFLLYPDTSEGRALSPVRSRSKAVCHCLTIRLVYAFLSISLLGQSVSATVGVSITGVVADSSGLPLSGAHITIDGLNKTTVAGWDGRFSVTELPIGNYFLTVSHIGYRDLVRPNVQVNEGVVTRIDFILEQAVVKQEEVLVKVPHAVRNIQFKPRIHLTSDHWDQLGVRTVGDALRNVPGVTVLEGDGSQRLSLRGCPSRMVAIDLDGIPLNDAGTGEAEIAHIDLGQLAAITVEFDGAGGKVHLQSLGFSGFSDAPRNLKITAGGGSFYTREIKGEYSDQFGLPKLFFSHRQFAAEGNFSYQMDNGSIHRRINNRREGSSSIGTVEIDGSRWNIDGGIYRDYSKRGVPGLIYSTPTPEAVLSNDRISGRLSSLGSVDRVGINLTGFVSRYVGRFISPGKQYDPESEEWKNHISQDDRQTGLRYGLSADAVTAWQTSRFDLGYKLKVDKYLGEDLLTDQVIVGGVGLGEAKRIVHQFDAGWRYSTENFGVQWFFAPLYSTQRIKDSGLPAYTTSSPSITLGCEKSLGIITANLAAGWGKSVSSPSFNALFMAENAFAMGNKDLKPERGESVNTTLGISSSQPQTVDWRMGFTWFRNWIEDLIYWRTNFLGKYYPTNLDRTRSSGVEINGTFKSVKGWILLSCSYIYNNALNDTPGDINRGKFVPLTALHSGSADLAINLLKVTASLRGRWIGRRYSTSSNYDPISTAGMGLSPYEIYDVNLMRRWPHKGLKFTTEFGIDNILNRSYRVIERSPMPGRFYNAEFSVAF